MDAGFDVTDTEVVFAYQDCKICGRQNQKFYRTAKSRCVKCLKEYQRKYRNRPQPHGLTKDKKYMLKKRYGLTVEQFGAMIASQDGRCAACGLDPSTVARSTRRILHVDHCHKTGRVRGLLCNGCNRALGLLNESAASAEGLIRYIKECCGNAG